MPMQPKADSRLSWAHKQELDSCDSCLFEQTGQAMQPIAVPWCRYGENIVNEAHFSNLGTQWWACQPLGWNSAPALYKFLSPVTATCIAVPEPAAPAWIWGVARDNYLTRLAETCKRTFHDPLVSAAVLRQHHQRLKIETLVDYKLAWVICRILRLTEELSTYLSSFFALINVSRYSSLPNSSSKNKSSRIRLAIKMRNRFLSKKSGA